MFCFKIHSNPFLMYYFFSFFSFMSTITGRSFLTRAGAPSLFV